MKLQDRVALVTASGRNIGRELCLTFAKEGADIAVNVRKNIEEGQSVVEEIKKLGRKAVLLVGDVSIKSDVDRMFSEFYRNFNRIDILINNAGIRPHTHFLDITEEEWKWVLGVGLNGAFYCAKAAVPMMVKQHSGCILNISGPDGFVGRKNRAHGVTVKAGLHGFTKALALDLGEYGIRVNTVVPSLVDTTRPSEWYPNHDETLSNLSQKIALGRVSTTEEFANVCLFVTSDHAAYITGQAIHVNGGRYMI